jgi:hypothetical protein
MAIQSRQVQAYKVADPIEVILAGSGKSATLLVSAEDETAIHLSMPTELLESLQAEIVRALRARPPASLHQ